MVRAGSVVVAGSLAVPDSALGLVIFAHGSGSSRFSPRNNFVADYLQEGALATLLMDLLTHDEEREDLFTGEKRFDVHLLAMRLLAATDWAGQQPLTRHLRIGYFGSSTGAAAALLAAARSPDGVGAVVSRGGRPDLAGDALREVRAPTLLLVGGADHPVLELNRRARQLLTCRNRLVTVPGATHLFAEPGALLQVARQARGWFLEHLHRPEQPLEAEPADVMDEID